MRWRRVSLRDRLWRRGGRVVRSSALVVSADPDARRRERTRLEAAGYRVVVCPGPAAAICLAVADIRGVRCTYVPPDVAVIAVDAALIGSRVASGYRAWFPHADIIEIGH